MHWQKTLLWVCSLVFCVSWNLGECEGYSSSSSSSLTFDVTSGGYNELAVILSPKLKKAECLQILENVKVAILSASQSLFKFSGGKIHFSSVNIQVPRGWTASDCQTSMETNKSIRKNDGDIFISPDHPIYDSQPWTQQSQGCRRPGDFIYVPRSFIKTNTNSNQNNSVSKEDELSSTTNQDNVIRVMGDELRNQFLRYRFGVFDSPPEDENVELSVNSKQHSLCYGHSVKDIVEKHPDLLSSRSNDSRASMMPNTRFTISKEQPPIYVLILENSQAMDNKDHWQLIQKSAKKFILHDLEDDARLGLVLFNAGAHVAHPIQFLHSRHVREGLTVRIKNKFSLSTKNDSCVMCGFTEALSALTSTSSSNAKGATFILVSQGKSTSLALDEEKHLLDLSEKHRIQLFSIAIPKQPQDDISLSLERLAHNTGGLSFFVPEESYGKSETELSTYVSLVDAFREIQLRTTSNGPFLIHEKNFASHASLGPLQEEGSFVVDKYIGRDTDFNVFAINRENGFLKSIAVSDRRGQQYRNIHDYMSQYHILSVYQVPFEKEENIGMNWTYSLERMPSVNADNAHIVRVTSKPRSLGEQITVKFFTNMDSHAVKVSPSDPIRLYAEVKLNDVPVIEAKVTAKIQGINQSGFLTPTITVQLFDNGNGDPDLVEKDGIYSRFLTDYSSGEGRYSVSLYVDDNQGRAFSYQRVEQDLSQGSSCCMDEKLRRFAIQTQKMGTFHRISHGDSFRIPTIFKHHQDNQGSSQSVLLPPSRILDLRVAVDNGAQELEFSWTAPGADFDQGKATSYQLFTSEDPNIFYTNLNASKTLSGFSATKNAGEKEKHRIKVEEDFDKTLYYVLIAIDEHGNLGEVSNVNQALMPSPYTAANNYDSLSDYEAGLDNNNGIREDIVIFGKNRPTKTVFYIIVGVVGFIVVCIVLILIIVLLFRKKKNSQNDLSVNMGVTTATSSQNGGNFSSNLISSPGFAVCDEQDILKEQQQQNEERNKFLMCNYSDNNQNSGMNFQQPEENNYSNTNYGWTELNNPYVTQSPSNNGSYQSFNGYAPNYQPTYARPVPKSQRINNSSINNSSNVYNNPMLNSKLQHSTPQSPSLNGGGSSSNSNQTIGNSYLYNNVTNSRVNSRSTSGDSSGDSRVPSISPPILNENLGEQIRLIGNSNSNTPTKSILKKPKDQQQSQLQTLQQNEDHSSQSSKEERCSESSNVSFSDREDTPNNNNVNNNEANNDMEIVEEDGPDFSPSNTYLETSFELDNTLNKKPAAPPTLPKPKPNELETLNNLSTMDKKIRNITQV